MSKNSPQVDYRAARGSNTGDIFHELWAVRQSLGLLDADTSLSAITVEGVSSEEGTDSRWDSVDCCLFFGGETVAEASRIEIQQLKYSAASPTQSWTAARLSTGRDGKVAASPIRRLANAFRAMVNLRPEKALATLRVSFLTNQPIAEDLLKILANARTTKVPASYARTWKTGAPDLHRLVHASGLTPEQFQDFVVALDLQGLLESRFAAEEEMLSAISAWSDTEFSEAANRLREYVRKRMLPEAAGELITREKILIQFGVSDDRALFPCPAVITHVQNPVQRLVAGTIVDLLQGGKTHLCLHGVGGVGKTTVLQEIRSMLPPGSIMVTYDCYGGGAYLDASAYRHRPQDAFVQLSNDIASALRVPLFLEPHVHRDHARNFRKRLDLAAQTLRAAHPDALLVVAIDAADNSVTAAHTRVPPERSFVHDFMSFEKLPSNVRSLVSARTGRLHELELPKTFECIPLPAFDEAETAVNVARYWEAAPQVWIADFHHLSEGVARVQTYAFDNSEGAPEKALDRLRPSGKKLDQVFREQLDLALRKNGQAADIPRLCAGLIALPRPIPTVELAATLGMSEAQVVDICTDLAPGIRNRNGLLSFSDEDFERFVRGVGDPAMPEIAQVVATRFLNSSSSDAYAAANVASALLGANRRQELLDLVAREPEPPAALLQDPVRRREVHLNRLQMAIRVCREARDPAQALRFVLIGAEAIHTEAAMLSLLADHPALTARHAKDTASRLILGDAELVAAHGPLLMHVLAEDAAAGDGVSVREGHRVLAAWFEARNDRRDEDGSTWDLSPEDGAAWMYAVLLQGGVENALRAFKGVRPRQFALGISKSVTERLVVEGRIELVKSLAADATDQQAIFILVPLALAGHEIDLPKLARGLTRLQKYLKIGERMLAISGGNNEIGAYVVDTVLNAAEILLARGWAADLAEKAVKPFLDPDLRRIDRRYDFEVDLLDAILRSVCLTDALAGRVTTIEDLFTPRPEPSEATGKRHRRDSDAEHDRQLTELVSSILPLYEARAAALTAHCRGKDLEDLLAAAQGKFSGNAWRLDRRHVAEAVRQRVAESLIVLAVAGVGSNALLSLTIKIRSGWESCLRSTDNLLFIRLAAFPALHEELVRQVAQVADSVQGSRIGAEEKSRALAHLAELIDDVSPSDAGAIFSRSIEVANELDREVAHQIRLIDRLIERGREQFASDRRAQASRMAEIVSDAAIRLQNQDHFPWDEAMRSIAQLDFPTALAGASRWDDLKVASLHNTLPPVLEVGLRSRALTFTQAVALAGVIEHVGNGDLASLFSYAANGDAGLVKIVADELAMDVLTERISALESLTKFVKQHADASLATRLTDQERLQSRNAPTATADTQPASEAGDAQSILSAHTWTAKSLVDAELLSTEVQDIIHRSRALKQYVSVEQVLEKARANVAVKDRLPHVDALCKMRGDLLEDGAIRALLSAAKAWSAYPAVRDWCSRRLPELIASRLPNFCRYISWDRMVVTSALALAGTSAEHTQEVLLRGLEQNVEFLGAETTFRLAGIIGDSLSTVDAAALCCWYLQRLASRIDIADQETVDTEEIPVRAEDGVARFLFAMLSDVDVRQRWRAAHAIRRLTRIGEHDLLQLIIAQYERRIEPAFRDGKAPFYWIAARLWLVATLSRICEERPEAARTFGTFLFRVATSETFPHVLIRDFSADACKRLIGIGQLSLTAEESEELDRVNMSPFPAATDERDIKERFPHFGLDASSRRFEFDHLDTLRYWYEPWLRVFANLTAEQFLQTAEHWILDEWCDGPSHIKGRQEPRQSHFNEWTWQLSSNGHGSLPTLERYRSYLEWHAMWCAVGQLLTTHPILEASYEGEAPLRDHVGYHKLKCPPVWLADLVCPRPLDTHLWQTPDQAISEWVDNVPDEAYVAELRASEYSDYVVVDAHIDRRSRAYRETVQVSTGLVSPATAHALVRALQTVEVISDYYICPEGNDLEISEPEYVLRGWLVNSEPGGDFDAKDTFRNGASEIAAAPGELVAAAMSLQRRFERGVRWFKNGCSTPSFIYQYWGQQERSDGRELLYDETVVSYGHRLLVHADDLAQFLSSQKRDLIAEVEITRSDKDTRRFSDDEEDEKQVEYERLFLLTHDGVLRGAERDFGTWRPFGPGTQA